MRRAQHQPAPAASTTSPVITATSADAQVISLASLVCDRVAELSRLCKAFAALERLVSPEYLDEEQAHVPASREQLGELLYSLNADFHRRMEALADAMVVLLAQAQMNAAIDRAQAR